MASPRKSRVSDDLGRKSLIASEDNRKASPHGKAKKTKHKRKSMNAAAQDSDKSATGALTKLPEEASNGDTLSPHSSMYRLSSTIDIGEKFEAGQSTRTSNSDIPNGNLLSTLRDLELENSDDDSRTKLGGRSSLPAFPNYEAANARINDQRKSVMNLLYEAKFEIETHALEKTGLQDAALEEKLANRAELDVVGTVDLSSVSMTEGAIPLIIERVFRSVKKKYTRIILRDNGLTSYGVKIFVDEMISVPTRLKSFVNMSNPQIGDEGVSHFIRLLQAKRSITTVALHQCGITDHGVRLLTAALCKTNDDIAPLSIEKLYLSFNETITDNSLEAILQIIQQCKKVKLLALQHCGLSPEVRRQIQQVVGKKKGKFSFLD